MTRRPCPDAPARSSGAGDRVAELRQRVPGGGGIAPLLATFLSLAAGWLLATHTVASPPGGGGRQPTPGAVPSGTGPAPGSPGPRTVPSRGELRVGADGEFSSIAPALEEAAPGDTVRVSAGTYREKLRVDRPVVLLGVGRPVIDGGGEGHVVEATAPLEIRGFAIRGSGTRVDREHAGVMVRGAPAVVADNEMEDVFYGVYLKDAAGSVVRGNRIRGKDLPRPRRGDGIRLWYSSRTRIEENVVERVRDVVVYFSDSLHVRGNRITDGRYGLHYMYSDHNVFEENIFLRNQVGAFVMYSSDVTLRRNVFAEAQGASGMGLGLKDADRIRAVDNLLVSSQSGVYLDNSPRTRDTENRFADNLFFMNGSGVRMLPSVRGNVFRGNSFVANRRPVEVSGGIRGGQAAQNDWSGNHWSDYAGFDRDRDGRGDSPFVYAKLSDQLLARHTALRLFSYSPVMPVIETLGRFFPLLKPEPVLVDSAPVLRARALARWESSPPLRLESAMRGEDPQVAGGRPVAGAPARAGRGER